jgi:copper chaperone CopZ
MKNTQQFTITGLTCGMCEAAVSKEIKKIAGVKNVIVSYKTKSAIIEAEQLIDLTTLQQSIDKLKHYKAHEYTEQIKVETTSWFITYKPLLIIFAYIAGIASITAFHNQIFEWEHFRLNMFLHNFMTGFFLVFSFFKLLDVTAFAKSFQQYDLLAKYIPGYAVQYPFIELSIGVACLLNYELHLIYLTEITIMSIGLVGVIQSNLRKQQIQCACLGTVFKLPMSKITIIENSIMIAVGIALLILNQQ